MLSSIIAELTCALRALKKGNIKLADECVKLAKAQIDLLSDSGVNVAVESAIDVLDTYVNVSAAVIAAKRAQ